MASEKYNQQGIKKDEEAWDSYIETNGTLKNNLGIESKEELNKAEKNIVLERLTLLHINPIDNVCNREGLFAIHEFLFKDIYTFAGKIRECTLSKNGYNFVHPDKINEELITTIFNYSNQIDTVRSSEELAFVIAPFYYDLIRIHPFREGNGRSIREFIRETVLEKCNELPFDVELDYTKIDKNNLMLGTRYRYMYPSMLEMEFMKGLVPVDKLNRDRGNYEDRRFK